MERLGEGYVAPEKINWLSLIQIFANNLRNHSDFVGTVALAKQLVDVPSYKLPSLLEPVGLANPNAHAAIADATATGMLFNKLLDSNAAQLGRQILDQAQFFNAAHAQCWQLPQRPPPPRL